MTFLVLLLILGSVYVGTNEMIAQESKTGFFVVLGIVGVIAILLTIL